MTEIGNISVVVPVFNEGQRIEAVLRKLLFEIDELLSEIVIIDDCSSDETADVLKHLVEEWPEIKVFRNSHNLGHGPSIMKGLEIALESSASHFLTYDGDGYLNCAEIFAEIRKINLYKEDVVLEIVRSGRSDPGYRKMITLCLRFCVTLLTLKKVSDPNTPSRVVSRNCLKMFLDITSPNIPVPSLWFGIFARRNRFKIKEIEVTVEIESPLEIRNHWNSKLQFFPSGRFVRFCLRAIRFWTWKK